MIIYTDMKCFFFSIMTSEVEDKINLPVAIPPPPPKKNNPKFKRIIVFLKIYNK